MPDPVIPMRPTVANAEILSVEWLFEPLWPGERVMARVDRGDVTLTDEAGLPAGAHLDEACPVLATAVLADGAVVDGVWTAQPFIGDGSMARTWADTLAAEGLAEELPDPLESERRRAFVAVDLVELDDQPLGDVPFQERRRLLESVIDEGVQVRLSPVVKHPLGSWLIGWRLGFLVAPETLMPEVGKLIEYNTSCSPVFVQRAGVAAMTQGEATVAAVRERLRHARDRLLVALRALPGVEAASPAGAMYAFFRVAGLSDSMAFCRALVREAKLGLAPGSAFGPEGEGFVRWCFAATDERLDDGVARLAAFLASRGG